MNKSKIFVLVSLSFVILLFVVCFLIYNSLFPKAPPIEVPSIDQIMIEKVTYPDDTYKETVLDDTVTYCHPFVNVLMHAKPTRIMSVNDIPDVSEHYTLSYVCEDKTYTYYIYESNGTYYAEIPYVGVYELFSI